MGKRRKIISLFCSLAALLAVTVSGHSVYAASDIQPVVFLDDPDPVAAAGSVNYFVKIQNNDPDNPAQTPRLEVTVPPGFSFASTDDAANCSYSGATPSSGGAADKVVCSWPGDLVTSRIVNITYTASDTPGTYPVTATAFSTNDSNLLNNVESNNTDVVESADLELVSKVGNPNPVEAGGIVTYQFVVSNSGPFTAASLVLSDQLPTGLTFEADNASPAAGNDGAWTCTASGQNVTCTAATLPVGATSTFYFRVKATASTTGSIINAASVNSVIPDPNPDNNTTEEPLSIIEGTDMSIAKAIDISTTPVIGGQPVLFNLTATNEGPMTADNVQVVDTLPTGYTSISVSTIPAGWACDPITGLMVTCRTTSMANGESDVITITATPPVVSDTVTHQNGADVSTTTPDPISINDSVIINYDVRPDIADLSISKSKSPDPVAIYDPGPPASELAVSTIVVTNLGPREADPVQVVDQLSDSETYDHYTLGNNWNCTHSGANANGTGGIVTCNYTDVPLAANASADDLVIFTQATFPGDLINRACTGGSEGSAAPDLGDSLTGNNCSNGGVVATSNRADVVVEKNTDDTLITSNPLENSFTYTVTVRNAGPNTAEAVDFNDIIPQYVSAGPGGRPATTLLASTDQGTCSTSGARVNCSLGNIVLDQTVTVTISVTRPMVDGTRTNTASAYSTLTGDPDRSNNVDTAVVTVQPVTDIEVTDKLITYANHPDEILAETEATYTIGVRNNGPSTATSVQLLDVFDDLEEGFTFISASVAGGGSCDPYNSGTRTLTCNLGSMNANTTKSITVKIRPLHLVPTLPWEINNTATVSMDPTIADSDPGNNSKDATLTIKDGSADLAIEKNESPVFSEPVRYDPDEVAGPNYIVYEVVVSNRGPSLANNVLFTDTMLSVNPLQATPQELEFVRDTENPDGTPGSSGICAIGGSNPFTMISIPPITCTLPAPGQLAAGASYTRYLVFEVLTAPEPIAGDSYTNQVTVSGDEPDPNTANDTEGETTTVRTVVDLGIDKYSIYETITPNLVEVEQPFDFTITVTNYGPGISPGATVTDNLPAGMVLTGTPTFTTDDFGVGISCSGGVNDTAFSCILGQMASDEDVIITMPVKLTAYPTGGTITNTASVIGLAPEPKDDSLHPNVDEHVVPVYQPAVIGNRVWLDRNANGIQDDAAGIDGVTVNLLDNTGAVIATRTTAGGGYYSFTINHAAEYSVQFIMPNGYLPSPANAGSDDALDSDAALVDGRTGTYTINYGDNNQTIDAGFYQLLSLGNRVWLDGNANGIQNGGELNIPDVTVVLLDAGLNNIASTTTDANGLYLFTDLEPGDYSVEITPSPWVGYLPSPVQTADPDNNNNTDSNIGSEPVPGTFRSGPVTLRSQNEPTNDGDGNNGNLTVDFGLVLPARVGNTVWLDENSDGIQDAGEPGIANVTVQLKNSAGTVIATTVTDTDGGYLFTGVAPDDYFIEVDSTTLPVGMSQTTIYPHPGADYANQDQSGGDGYAVTLTSGGENLTSDFGYNWSPTVDVITGQNDGALGDRIWIDSNGNGRQDNGEPGVAGAVVTLHSAGTDGLFWTADDITTTTTTDAAGKYIFDDLAAGVYTVEVTDSSSASHDFLAGTDYSQTGDPDHYGADSLTAPAGTAADNRSTLPVVLGPGDTFVNADFGYQPEASTAAYDIGDILWLDLDRDGVIDPGENGIGGVTVGLQNSAGQFIATTTTAADGSYLFTDLVDGQEYTVVITDSANVLAGLVPTYDADSLAANPDGRSTLTLASADDLDQDFGYVPVNPGLGTGAIGDTIFLDRNTNNAFDPGEGIEGIRVFLKNNSGDIIAVTYTDENGKYIFGGLGADIYSIEVDTTTLPAGLTNTIDPDGGSNSTSSLSLTAGQINLLQDFGYAADTPGTLGNYIWLDTNADGIFQANGVDNINGTADDELPIEGVTVELYLDLNGNDLLDPNESLIGSTITNASGAYLFEGLPAEDYIVKVSDSQGVLQGYWHSIGTANADNNSQAEYYAVTLPAGGNIVTADFGYYYKPGSLGNLVWQDVDVSGLYDGAIDTPLAGITVFLDVVYPDGTLVTVQTITDASGLYLFPNLLLDENYNGIDDGAGYGNGGEEPSHTVRIDATTILTGLDQVYPTREQNTDATTVGGIAADDENTDIGSDNPAGEVAFPPMGGSDITNDFGYFLPGSIGDTIWNDQNNDGLFAPGEGMSGVTVSLTPPANVDLGNGLGVAVTTTTSGTGGYLFNGLPPGLYTVAVVESSLPPYLQGYNTVDPDGGNNATSDLTLTVAENNLDQDFAYFRPSAIGNFVWDDSNGDGIQNNGEAGHQGIAVHLLDINGAPVEDPLHPGLPYIVQTGPNGEYLFENLLPDTYQVKFILPANNTFTLSNEGGNTTLDSDPDQSTGLVTVILGPNEVNADIDAGLVGPAINIEKSTNGIDADTPPGVLLAINAPVTWTYLVTNTGNVALTSVSVSDSKIGIISCPATMLNAGDSMTCTDTGTAVAGQYINIGSVIGSPPSGPAVLDTDPSHYLAGSPAPAIDIEKATNGFDADSGTGPVISIGETVTWTYVVTNSGNVDLTGVAVSDNIIGNVACPLDALVVGESMTCTATGTAVAGQYTNIGSVTGTPPSGPNVSDNDPSHYFGSIPGVTFASVDIEKATDGYDADTGTGPYAEIGLPVIWSYVVTNTGNVDLNNVTITDNMLADTAISCPNDGNTDNRITLLPVGAEATCTASANASAGQYANTGSVVGTPPTGPNVGDTDPSHYFGSNGAINIEKYTNGSDADTPPGPSIKVERDVFWTYVATNTGPFPLTNVSVTDDMGVTVSCPQDSLAIGESMTCTGSGLAIEGQYANMGSVSAETPKGAVVTDSDPSHYIGKTFFWHMFVPAITSGCPVEPDFCYVVADGDNEGSDNSPLFKYVFETKNLELLNRLGVDAVESIVLSLDGRTLYGIDGGVFGIIDPRPGIVNSFTPIDPSGIGGGWGALGYIELDDIDGLSFDPTSGALYATFRYGDGLSNVGELDILLQIDPKRGKVVPNAFGAGTDYVIINSAAVGANDVDDIAVDTDGTLYGIAGNSGGGGDHLVKINKVNGTTSDFGALNENGGPVQDMEGLTLYNTRILYGTTGLEFTAEGTDNTLYKIDKNSGKAEKIIRLDQDFNGYIPSDFEAIACFPVCK